MIATTPAGGVSYTWFVGNLSATQGGVITITGVVSTGLPAGYAFTNTAAITAATVESDTTNNSVSRAVTIANLPAVAMDDRYTTTEDIPLTVTAAGVLANDRVQSQRAAHRLAIRHRHKRVSV